MPYGCEITVIAQEGLKDLSYNLKPNGIYVIAQEVLMDSYNLKPNGINVIAQEVLMDSYNYPLVILAL